MLFTSRSSGRQVVTLIAGRFTTGSLNLRGAPGQPGAPTRGPPPRTRKSSRGAKHRAKLACLEFRGPWQRRRVSAFRRACLARGVVEGVGARAGVAVLGRPRGFCAGARQSFAQTRSALADAARAGGSRSAWRSASSLDAGEDHAARGGPRVRSMLARMYALRTARTARAACMVCRPAKEGAEGCGGEACAAARGRHGSV